MHRHRFRPDTRSLLGTLALAALACAVVAAPSLAAPHGRSAAPPRLGDARIGSDDAGDTLATWTRGNSIEAAVQPANRTWGPSQVLVKMNFPVGYWSLAVGRDGLALLVWERRIGATSTIWARTARLPGSAWSPAVRVSGPAGVGVRAVVQAAVAPDGRAIAVWRERHAGRFVLLGAVRAAGATAWTAHAEAIGSACVSAFTPELSAGGGSATAAWVCFERTGARRLRTVKLNAAGAFSRVLTIAR
jgi:hypothetical protein